MELHYCAICGMRITESELQKGEAVLSAEKRALCQKCYADVSVAKGAPAKPPSRIIKAPIQPAHSQQSHTSHHSSRSAYNNKKPAAPSLMVFGIAAAAVAIIAFAVLNRKDSAAENKPVKAEPEKVAAKIDKPAPPACTITPPESTITPPTPEKKFDSSFKAIPLGSKGNKRGYWEFLPSAYYAKPNEKFPIVIFFTNVPESGDGSTSQLDKVLKCGPPKVLSDATHPLHNFFEERSVIVICMQGPPAPDWWHGVYIEPVLKDIFNAYRIDRSRIYYTGIIAGALGLHELMDQFPDVAGQAAAYWMECSQGGAGLLGAPKTGPEIGSKTPYWAFVNVKDATETVIGVENIVAKITGKERTSMMSNALNSGQFRTATFSPAKGWTWSNGIVAPTNTNPTLTLVEGTPEETYTAAYNSRACWEWLISQKKK